MNVVDGVRQPDIGYSKLARARRLVADGQVQAADLVVPPVADGVLDVEQLVVFCNPAVGLGRAAGDVVHVLRRREWEAGGFDVLEAGVEVLLPL